MIKQLEFCEGIKVLMKFLIDPTVYLNGLLYFLSSLAQCAAAFAALVSVFAVFRFQANGEMVRKLYGDINEWLVRVGRSTYADHDPPELIRRKIEGAKDGKFSTLSPERVTEGAELWKRLESLEKFPGELGNKASKPLKQWALICFVSLVALMVFDITFIRTKGSMFVVGIILSGWTAYGLSETKNFIQECLKS